jgi:uncharacterized membrane protein YkvI
MNSCGAKMRKMHDAFLMASLYISAVIGAGFASGQEIWRFFTRFGIDGIFGIILAGVLFCVLGTFVIGKVFDKKTNNFSEFILSGNGKFVGKTIQLITRIFLLMLFCIMVTGIGSMLKSITGIPQIITNTIALITCLVLVIDGVKGISYISQITAPILILGIFIICFTIISGEKINPQLLSPDAGQGFGWVVSALLYVSYNCLCIVPVLCNVRSQVRSKGSAIAGGIIAGVVLMSIALLLNQVMLSRLPHNFNEDFPVLLLIENQNKLVGMLYFAILFIAMLVCAVSSGVCFCKYKNTENLYFRIKPLIFLAISSIILGTAGFAGLISFIYPLFAIPGAFLFYVSVSKK